MRRKTNKSAVRIVSWIAVVFGLCVAGLGALISLADGGRDLGGMVGGVFIFGGLSLAIMALPHSTSK